MSAKPYLAALVLALALSGCGVPDQPAAPTPPGFNPETGYHIGLETLPAPTEPSLAAPETAPTPTREEPLPGTDAPTEIVPPSTEVPPPPTTVPATPTAEPAPPETTAVPETDPLPAPAEGLRIVSTGLYTGPYPEDGTDEDVDSVALLLVENTGDRALQYGELVYSIDGREAVFRLSELPPGATVAVLAADRLVATPVSVYEPRADRTLTVFHDLEDHPDLEFTSQGGELTVTNEGSRTYAALDVCYKLRYDETTLLGGIAYHVRFTDLGPGQTQTTPAGHYYPEACVIVAVTGK